jgi:RNA polymerase-binding transcription factor DksA
VCVTEISNESVRLLEARLDDVDRTLARLRDGSYRHCDVCSELIDDALLLSEPLRTTCVAHPRFRAARGRLALFGQQEAGSPRGAGLLLVE